MFESKARERERERKDADIIAISVVSLAFFVRLFLFLKLTLSRLLFAIKSLKIVWLRTMKYVLLSIILIVDGLLIVYRTQTNKRTNKTNAKRHINTMALLVWISLDRAKKNASLLSHG